MTVIYFADTDTLHIEFRPDAIADIAEMRDLDKNTLLELDERGHIVALTLEHATERSGSPVFSYRHVAARQPA